MFVVRSCLLALGVIVLVAVGPFAADTFLFGPQRFEGTGNGVLRTRSFTVTTGGDGYLLRVRNNGVTLAIVVLNQQLVLRPAHFGAGFTTTGAEDWRTLWDLLLRQWRTLAPGTPVPMIERPVTLRAGRNDLVIAFIAPTGRSFTLEVVKPGATDTTPPVITTTLSPLPNSSSWNRVPVTVTFSCSDSESGIATCPPAVTVSTEGANQVIAGTAVDKVGNQAAASAIVNLDVTPPVVTAAAAPPANGNNWNNSPVIVSFAATDALSGVDPASVTTPVTLGAEGKDLSAFGQAADLAGNVGTVTRGGINIDLTSPVITITSPPNGSVGGVAGVTLAGAISDALSGVTTVACNGQPGTVSGGTFQCGLTLAQGSNSISALATDAAGNTTAAPWALTFTPPTAPAVLTLAVAQPANGAILAQSPVTVRGTVSDPGARVVVQNVIASVVGTTFEARNIGLSEGSNQILVRASTIGGAQASATINLTLDSTPPVLTVFSPPDRALFTAAAATVSATVSDATALSCSINGAPVTIQTGLFSSSVVLANGANEVSISCQDAAGHTSSRALTLFQDAEPPVVIAIEPADGATGVSTTPPIQIRFSEPVDPATVTPGTVSARAGTTILPVTVSVSPDGLTAAVTPVVPLPEGNEILVTVTNGVKDLTGNPMAVPFISEFTTTGTAAPPGVVIGEVYDDRRSLPLKGAIVEALDRATRLVLSTTETDERGKYLLEPGQTNYVLRISRPGFTSAERTTADSLGSFAEAMDARLTARGEPQTIQALFGGTVTAPGRTEAVVIPPGAFDPTANVSLTLTSVSGQGPIAAFPPGWSPLSIIDLDAPEGAPFQATLRLVDRSQTAGGRNATLARYDKASASWLALAQVVVPVGTPLEFSESLEPSQFALLIPDQGEGAPAAALRGQPLPSGVAGTIPPEAQATGEVNPPVGRADDPTPAQATIDITSQTPLRSGTLLRGDFMEVIILRSGGQVSPLDTSQDFVAYRSLEDGSGRTLIAEFPIAPSRVFNPADVSDGSITVRLSRGLTTAKSIIGASGGGVSSSDGSSVIAPSGAFAGDVPVELRRLDSTTFPLASAPNVTFIGGLELTLSGVTAGLPLTLSLSGSGSSVPTGSTVVVAQVRSVKGVERLVVVALAQINGSDLMSVPRVEGIETAGVRQSGRYGFYRFDGALSAVSGTARDEAGRREGHIAELASLPFVSITSNSGTFVLVSQPGSFSLVATAAANGDQARASGTTGTPLPEIVIGATAPRVEEITVRLAELEGDFAGPVALLGRPAPLVDDDSSGGSAGNGNGQIDAGEQIELTLFVRNDGTVPIQGGFFVLDVRGPPGPIQVQPANVPLGFLAPDEPLAVGPFVFSVPGGTDPALLRYRLAYANNGGLANVIPFLLPLGVQHPNVHAASEITIRFSEPIVESSLNGAVTLSREDGATIVPENVALAVASDNRSLILRPFTQLASDTIYRITLTSQVVDVDARSLANAPYVERLRTQDRTPPPLIPAGQIEASVPDEGGFVTITGSQGSVNQDDVVIGLNATTGFSALATVNADGSFTVRIRADATDELSILIRDRNDNTTTVPITTLVRRDPVRGQVLAVIVNRDGGTVSTPEGIRLIVPAGAVQRGTELFATRLSTPFELPADLQTDAAIVAAFNARLTVLDRVRITSNVTRFAGPIKLSVPASQAAVGDQFVVWRTRSVTYGGPLADIDRLTGIPFADNPIATADRLVIVESATVKSEGGELVLSTDSPPFPGITEPGDYTFARLRGPLIYLAGEVRRDTITGPVVPGVVVRSLPDALATSPFAAVTDNSGRFLVADGSLTGPFEPDAVVSSRLDVADDKFSRVIRRDVRGTVGPPAPPVTVVAQLEEPFVLPTRLPPEITEVLGDLEPPTVKLVIEGPTFNEGFSAVGSPLTVSVKAEDNDELTSVDLELDQGAGFSPVVLSPQRTFDMTPTTSGLLTFRAQARDRSDNSTFADALVRVLSGGGGGGGTVGPCDFTDPNCITVRPGPPQLLFSQCPAFDGSFEAQFSEPMNLRSVSPATIRILEPNGFEVDYTSRAANNNSRFIITPDRYLRLGVRYRLELTNGLTDAETPPVPFAGKTVECDVAPPTLLTVIGKPDPNSTTRSADVQAINGETVADVATVGDTVVAVSHPRGSSPADVGHLHTFQLEFSNNGTFEKVDTLATVPVRGRPQSLATDGTTAYVGNRYLGSIATKSPFVSPVVVGAEPLVFPDTMLGCGVDLLTPVCVGLSLFWDAFPQPASNLEVFDLGDVRNPDRLGAAVINSILPDTWDPNTWPNRVEVTPQGIAVHNFLNNVEFFSPGVPPASRGIVGQIIRYGEATPRGADGRHGTADDLENEFLDAAFFDGFAVTQVRDGIRVMSTGPLEKTENSTQLGFYSLPGAHGGRLGGVPNFQWGGADGVGTTSDLAFITTTDNTLHIYDVTDPRSPEPKGTLPNTFGNMSFDPCRGIAYVHGRFGEFHVVDFNDPEHPLELNRPDDPTQNFTVRTLLGRRLLGRTGSFNGNTNRNGVVYLANDEGVAALRIVQTSPSQYRDRDACQLHLIPSHAIVPVHGTHIVYPSKGGRSYAFTVEADSSGGASVVDNGNGTATYTAGPNAGTTIVQVDVSNSPGEIAKSHFTVARVTLEQINFKGIGNVPIRIDASTFIGEPAAGGRCLASTEDVEWVRGLRDKPNANGQRWTCDQSAPVAVLRGMPLRAEVLFRVEPTSVSAISVRGVSIGPFGNFESVNPFIPVVGGIAVGEFMAASKPDPEVGATDAQFHWRLEAVVAEMRRHPANVPVVGGDSVHRVYTLLDTPRPPMAVPWATVLELAAGMANDPFTVTRTAKDAARLLTIGVHHSRWQGLLDSRFIATSAQLIYDPFISRAEGRTLFFQDGWDKVDLQAFIDSLSLQSVSRQCADNSLLLAILARSIGIPMNQLYIDATWLPWLLDKTFFPMKPQPYVGAGEVPPETEFAFHQVAILEQPGIGALVYDPSLRPSSTSEPYNNMPIDTYLGAAFNTPLPATRTTFGNIEIKPLPLQAPPAVFGEVVPPNVASGQIDSEVQVVLRGRYLDTVDLSLIRAVTTNFRSQNDIVVIAAELISGQEIKLRIRITGGTNARSVIIVGKVPTSSTIPRATLNVM